MNRERKGMRALIAAGAALTLLAFAGCGPDHVYLRPASTEVIVNDEGPPSVRRRVPPNATGGLDLTISSSGIHEHGEVTTLSVRVQVENRGEGEGRILPAQSYIVDRPGRTLHPSRVSLSGAGAAASEGGIAVQPGEKRIVDVEFATEQDPKDADELAPLRFVISAEWDGKSYSVDVPFAEVPRYSYPSYYDPYYYPYYGGPYGYGPYYPYYGYYRPWGYPYFYPSVGLGFGYYYYGGHGGHHGGHHHH